MPYFFIALLKINLALLLFTAAYYLVLRRLTFYMINRVFLCVGIVFSSAYPFIDLTEIYYQLQHLFGRFGDYVPAINNDINAFTRPEALAGGWLLINYIFWLGVVVMGARLLLQFISLYQLHRRSKPGRIGNRPVRLLEEPISPFSFWKNIYINPARHRQAELESIMEHEAIHVKQLHTIDILLAELTIVFYWFNPGVWLMSKAVKENLEFITDTQVLKRGVDRKAYQYSLIEVSSMGASSPLVNSFNLADIRRRIQMMNAARSSKVTLTRYFVILPVVLVFTLAFTINKREVIFDPATQSPAKPITLRILPEEKENPVAKDRVNLEKLTRVTINDDRKPKSSSAGLTNTSFVAEEKTGQQNIPLILSEKTTPKAFEIKKPAMIPKTGRALAMEIIRSSAQKVNNAKPATDGPVNPADAEYVVVGYQNGSATKPAGTQVPTEPAPVVVEGMRTPRKTPATVTPEKPTLLKIVTGMMLPAARDSSSENTPTLLRLTPSRKEDAKKQDALGEVIVVGRPSKTN